MHSNYTLITGQTKCMLFYVKGNVSANFASQTRNRNIMGREPSFETIEIRGPTHTQPACSPYSYIDLQFVDVEKQLFEGLNPADCFLDGNQAPGHLLVNHKSNRVLWIQIHFLRMKYSVVVFCLDNCVFFN